MIELFKKLMFARQMSFDRGSIKLMHQRVLMIPASVFPFIISESDNYWKSANAVYKGCKVATWKGFTNGLIKEFKMDPHEVAKWLKDLNELSGNGETNVTNVNFKENKCIIEIKNSPFVETIGKSKIPIDHALRGYFAGGASATFGIDVDCIETECQAKGDSYCKFIMMPKQDLLKIIGDNDILKKQLEE